MEKSSLSKGFSKRTTATIFFFPFKRTFALKIPVQMFAYFISKVPCNIYHSLQVHDEKNCFSDTTAPFGTREDRKIIFHVLILSLPRERIISLYNWFTRDTKFVSWKVLNRFKRQRSFSMRWTIRIFVPLSSWIALWKSRRKLFLDIQSTIETKYLM